jgi:hypothetical protein
MSLLFILLDTVVKFGFVIVFGLFIRSLVRGDFRLNPNHTYAEAMEPEQCKTLTCGECYACQSYEAYREGELRKSCGCDMNSKCYCKQYEQYNEQYKR